MSRKNHNSVLFLTTLGVYLGLVLVGATPQVLAQAATAKQFSVKDEIGRKDDLDNTPEGCRVAEIGSKIIELHSTYLWYNYRSISEHADLIEEILSEYSDVPAYDARWTTTGEVRPWRAVEIINTASIGIDRSEEDVDGDMLLLANGLPGKSFVFSAVKDDSGYTFRSESNTFPHDPPLVRYLYQKALDFRRCLYDDEVEQLIALNTEIKVESRNLIITTRLPRGSLDTLLASNAQ